MVVIVLVHCITIADKFTPPPPPPKAFFPTTALPIA